MRILRLGDTGTDVMEIQAVLNKIGFSSGTPDGVFGSRTQQAVRAFQQNFGLTPDGVIGERTHAALAPYLQGYAAYTVRPGDTLSNIARRFYTEVPFIIFANPGIDPDNLQIGQQITVPYGFDVVDTNISYTYDILERDLQGLAARYPFIGYGSAGTSVLGRQLYYIRLGTGPNEVFFNGAHHSLEWITAPLLMKFAEDFLKGLVLDRPIRGFNTRRIWETSSIYILPMVNPDGVDLVLNGLSPDNPYYSRLIRWNNNSTDFSRTWQANIRGVDLNHNYNAAWELSKAAEAQYGITGPGPTRYSGPYPESEPETRTVADFTRAHNFRLVLAYHSQGEIIYWNFMNLATEEARIIGETLAADSGYTLDTATGIASYAGYKDWFIQEYRRPGYTVEVGRGQNPLPISQFDKIYSDNLTLLLRAATITT